MTGEAVDALVTLAEIAMELDEEQWPADSNYLDSERDCPACYYCGREIEGALREVDRHHAPTCPWGRFFDALREVRRLMDDSAAAPVDPPSIMAVWGREVSESLGDQLQVMPNEVASYLAWRGVIPWRWLQTIEEPSQSVDASAAETGAVFAELNDYLSWRWLKSEPGS